MSRERGEELFVACLDLEKAYDRVNHWKLFDILEMRGINKRILDIMKESYAKNKVKFVLGDFSQSGVVSQAVSGKAVLYRLYYSMYTWLMLGEC